MCWKCNEKQLNIYAFDDVAKYSCPHSYGIVATHIIKPLANRITRLLLMTDVTPNDVTFYSFVMGMIGGLFLMIGTYYSFFIGALLFFAAFVLDYVDGQIARIKNLCSEKGKYYDIIVDRLLDGWLVMSLAIGLGWYSKTAYIIGFFALMGVLMLAMVVYTGLEDISGDGLNKFITKSTPSIFNKLKQFAPTKDNRAFMLIVFAVFNQAYIALLVMAVAVNIFWILLLYMQIDKF